MPFDNSLFAAGPYDATYYGVDLGLMVGDQQAPSVEIIPRAQLITNTHRYGRTVLGAIGMGDEAFVNFILMEYRIAVMEALWGGNLLAAIRPSSDWFDYADAFILTAQGGTLAASVGPASRTLYRTVLQEDFALREQFGPQLREIPIRMRCFPESDADYTYGVDG